MSGRTTVEPRMRRHARSGSSPPKATPWSSQYRSGGSCAEGADHDVSQHDAKRRPHLPLHDKRAANGRRRTLRSIDRNRCRLCTDAESEDEARDKEVHPAVAHALPYRSNGSNETGDEYSAPSSENLVHWFGQPATDNGTSEIRSANDQPSEVVLHRFREAVRGNAQFLLILSADIIKAARATYNQVEGLRPVVDGLVHTLDSGRKRGHGCSCVSQKYDGANCLTYKQASRAATADPTCVSVKGQMQFLQARFN